MYIPAPGFRAEGSDNDKDEMMDELEIKPSGLASDTTFWTWTLLK